ncbi:MAG: TolC family outer membrane protein [Alphaproteobacteria bacterium]|nr:TolC family outer membrane protein [Alphaproteobacteria bacterium SS10]
MSVTSQNHGAKLRHMLLSAAAGSALLVAAGLGAPAQAQSFDEALRLAYETNPTIDAARADLRSVDELVPQARGGYLPSLIGDLSAGVEDIEQDTGTRSDGTINPLAASLSLSQNVYRGGRTVAEISQAKNTVFAQRGSLFDTEQDVLLAAATAYFDVVLDQAVVELNKNNEGVLERQLQASRDRFDVGEVTRTDVSQSESRLARAVSDRIAAEGNLNISRSEFARVVGQMPEILSQPDLNLPLPSAMEEAVNLALDANPTVLAAEFSEAAARDGIDIEFGDLLPTITLDATAQTTEEPSLFTDSTDSVALTAAVRIPLYQSGVASSQVREAKQTAARARRLVDEAVRNVTDTTIAAWEALESSRAQIVSRNSEVDSAEIALEGVRQEALVGSRTTLDVLDAEQELLDAQVSLVTAVRDEAVASFQLLAAIGSLTPQALEIDANIYDPTEHYERVEDKIWGIGTSLD